MLDELGFKHGLRYLDGSALGVPTPVIGVMLKLAFVHS
jgi:hypothetical protein